MNWPSGGVGECAPVYIYMHLYSPLAGTDGGNPRQVSALLTALPLQPTYLVRVQYLFLLIYLPADGHYVRRLGGEQHIHRYLQSTYISYLPRSCYLQSTYILGGGGGSYLQYVCSHFYIGIPRFSATRVPVRFCASPKM